MRRFGVQLALVFVLGVGCWGRDPVPARPLPARQPATPTLSGPDRQQLTVAGHALEVPAHCQLASGGIRCPRAALDWLEGTGNDLDGAVNDLATPTITIVARFSFPCEVAAIKGDGEIVTVEEAGRRTPVFLCAVPYGGAYSMVRCIGYDPRVRPSGDPPVPDPCNQVVPWQPILVSP